MNLMLKPECGCEILILCYVIKYLTFHMLYLHLDSWFCSFEAFIMDQVLKQELKISVIKYSLKQEDLWSY